MARGGRTTDNAAEWFGAYGTWAAVVVGLAAVVVALVVYITDVRAKRHAEEWAQAEQISAWEEGEIARDTTMDAVIALLNASTNPVHRVVVTLVIFKGGLGPSRDGREANRDFQTYLRILPPGKHYTLTAGDYHGMMSQPAVEVAFTDKGGKHWLRDGDGKLVRLMESPAEHYKLDLPLTWGFPEDRRPG